MSLKNVELTLKIMGIEKTNIDYFASADEFAKVCEQEYNTQAMKLLNKINYLHDEPVPRELEHVVDNWTAAAVIYKLRAKDPSLGVYLKYTSSGTNTEQFALLDGSKAQDPVAALAEVPVKELRRFRRLYPYKKRER
ncbi:MAG: hypothetical protein MJ014_00145 [Methanocorpusculum sp.]|nr:hypothetical protein [Methanocorpusculum sp.]